MKIEASLFVFWINSNLKFNTTNIILLFQLHVSFYMRKTNINIAIENDLQKVLRDKVKIFVLTIHLKLK